MIRYQVQPSEYRELCTKYATDPQYNFVSIFARELAIGRYMIYTVFAARNEGKLTVINYETEKEVISLSDLLFPAALFEREMQDQFGLVIVGGVDTRPLVKHECWPVGVYPLQKAYPQNQQLAYQEEPAGEYYPFMPVKGEGTYQIPVGPVHAGIIEPGHFRFSTVGEPIDNLEIRLMYVHRGVEKLLENRPLNQLPFVFERISGESSAVYQLAYALLIEKMAGKKVNQRISAIRMVLCELERIYNYLGDIAGIAIDVAYSYVPERLNLRREFVQQLNERLTGSRFLRNSIIPGGVKVGISPNQWEDLMRTIQAVDEELVELLKVFNASASFLDRVELTGIVYPKTAKELELTGPVLRATGMAYDVRKAFAYELYNQVEYPLAVLEGGGVYERLQVKAQEIRNAVAIIGQLRKWVLAQAPLHMDLPEISAGKEEYVLVETVKGEAMVYGVMGSNQRFDRLYLKTPSFTNWAGLTYAVIGEIVPDFPLCNKSFNLSYAENDR